MLSIFAPELTGHEAGQTRAPERWNGSLASEVLHEQLDYLIDHARNCRDECSVCRRFFIARDAIMRVWR